MNAKSRRRPGLPGPGTKRTSRQFQFMAAVALFLAVYLFMFYFMISRSSVSWKLFASQKEVIAMPIADGTNQNTRRVEVAKQQHTEQRSGAQFAGQQVSNNVNVNNDPSMITHQWYPNRHGPFAVLGAYGIDGDQQRPSYSAGTRDTLLVVVGTGEFVPGLLAQNMQHADRAVPKLECVITRTGSDSWIVPVVVHTNGTVFQGRLNRYESNKYAGEKTVWMSCLIDGAHAVADDGEGWPGSVVIRDVEQKHFETQELPLEWFLSGRYKTAPEHRLVQCSAPIYGIKGTRWLIEWIQYHQVMGFDHMHLYLYKASKAAMAVADEYRKLGFVTIHDWSLVPEYGIRAGAPHIKVMNWEHGQRLTRNDCYLRNRGKAGYILFTDVDELLATPLIEQSDMELDESEPEAVKVMKWCEASHARDHKKIGFAFQSVTTPPFPVGHVPLPQGEHAMPIVYVDENDSRDSGLIQSHIQVAENRCQSPYNCGIYHHGRQKFLMNTKYGSINPNGPMFYHAVSEEYDLVANHLMQQVPSSVAHLRHYAGHFSHVRKGGLAPSRGKLVAFSSTVLHQIADSIRKNSNLHNLYMDSPEESFLKLSKFQDTWRFAKEKELMDMPKTQKPTKREVVRSTKAPKTLDAPQQIQQPPQVSGANNNANVLKSSASATSGTKERFLTFERYGGRLNNQLLTYDWVFRLSKAFKRTALIHKPVGEHDREHWIGLPDSRLQEESGASLWDIPKLRKAFQFIFEFEVDESHGSVANHPVLGKPVSELNPNCVWDYNKHTKYISIWLANANKFPECEDRVHLLTANGLVHPYKSDTSKWGVGALDFWKVFRPNPYLVNEAQRFIDSNPTSGSMVGIHTRAHNSYGEPLEKSLKRCQRLAQKTLNGAVKHVQAVQTCCTQQEFVSKQLPSVEKLQSDWEQYHLDDMCHVGQDVINLVLASDPKSVQIVLASDHEQKDVDELVYKNGGQSYQYSPNTIKGTPSLALRRNNAWFNNIEGVLMDMTLMSMMDVFFGSPSSTVSIVICFWRLASSEMTGKSEHSNMCEFVLQAAHIDKCEGVQCTL